jgi:hypothetical protein
VIGLDLSRPERACWPLDAAYLSLELATPVRGVEPTDIRGGMGAGGRGVEVRVERAEQALAGHRRTLVRGLAGSGKTTLLQWLAVSTARRSLPPELDHLADCLPFVLPLRTLVRRGELPAPHEYLTAVGCPRDGAQPTGWVDQALIDGRALLLIDGLDEVPQAQRAKTRQWLRELLAAYPQAAYLVTTRPSAVPEGWLADGGFTELTVRPMSTRDVAVFVTRWHTAAASDATTDQERAHLATLEETLKDTVRSQRDLARLTTTPLLCALVCALHRDRRGHLPHGRMALYEAALSMLMHRRDRERDIEAPEGLSLTEHQSVQLLQRLAYWLIRNGQTELDHDTARALVDDALPAMPHIAQQADAEGVLTHLLARSGLLRQPTAETIDFVHRTFQDYLGAKAAIEARDIPLLVRHAHDDQWEDVLRMAVAHARPHERASLLRRLITRGDRTPKHRTRLHLLATACLEHATELDPAVREDVQQRTAALLPPRSDEEARTLAAVGPVILDLLPGPEGSGGRRGRGRRHYGRPYRRRRRSHGHEEIPRQRRRRRSVQAACRLEQLRHRGLRPRSPRPRTGRPLCEGPLSRTTIGAAPPAHSHQSRIHRKLHERRDHQCDQAGRASEAGGHSELCAGKPGLPPGVHVLDRHLLQPVPERRGPDTTGRHARHQPQPLRV